MQVHNIVVAGFASSADSSKGIHLNLSLLIGTYALTQKKERERDSPKTFRHIKSVYFSTSLVSWALTKDNIQGECFWTLEKEQP